MWCIADGIVGWSMAQLPVNECLSLPKENSRRSRSFL